MKNLKDYNTQDLSIVALQARLQRDQRLFKRCLELLDYLDADDLGPERTKDRDSLVKDIDIVLQEWER